MGKMLLPDINVWLALVFDAHVHHQSALEWMSSIKDEMACFCRLTQQGFLRLSNNPKVFPNDAVSTDDAWQLYDTTLSDPRVTFVDEPLALEAAWRPLTVGRQFSPKLWNDAYLLAFAEAGGYEIVTFDHGFTRYQGVRCTILA
jgi:toxin-antitoxin system PIN domain toxin